MKAISLRGVRRLLAMGAVLGLIGALLPAMAFDSAAPGDGHADAGATRVLARDAYYYAYPMVLMDVTMKQTTNVPDATTAAMRAPVNQLAHFRTYPKADSRDVVRFNFDTLYSSAWVDLSKEPMILTVPDTHGRYYLMPTLDMWSDVFSSVGSRTTGTKAGHYAYVAPGWQGPLPAGVVEIKAPTSTIWLLGRIQTNGPSDYENVHKLQDGLKLTPLSAWGKEHAAPAASPVDSTLDTKTPPLVQAGKLSGVEMIQRLAELTKKYPPHPNDYPILFRLKAIGFEPGRSWDPGKLDQATVDAINAGAKDAAADMIKTIKTVGTRVNGWSLLVDNVGTYGTSYRQRAVVALAGLGANLPADAIYPTAFLDGDGKALDASHKYLLHFDKGRLPPAAAFWSVTMYDNEGFQVPNPLDRFAIGDRDKLHFNADGSLDLYLQTDSPGKDKESNWLPAPKSGAIGPTMRIYAPKQEALDGTWAPPPLKRTD
jgi:hypothetical protein